MQAYINACCRLKVLGFVRCWVSTLISMMPHAQPGPTSSSPPRAPCPPGPPGHHHLPLLAHPHAIPSISTAWQPSVVAFGFKQYQLILNDILYNLGNSCVWWSWSRQIKAGNRRLQERVLRDRDGWTEMPVLFSTQLVQGCTLLA